MSNGPNSREETSIDTLSSSEPLIPSTFPRVVYLQNTCASCDAPLDTSEQDLNFVHPTIFCTLNQTTDHLPLACGSEACGQKIPDLQGLKQHCHAAKHESFKCGVSTCQQTLSGDRWSLEKHFQHHPEVKFRCNKCQIGFDTPTKLDQHCSSSNHAGYHCPYPNCNSECGQSRDLQKHQLIHKKTTARYPCNHCRAYRGMNGFKRKDHLRQHIRKYHRIEDYDFNEYCYHGSCYHKSFQSLEEYTDHTLQEHQSMPYICRQKDCDRKDMNGFANKNELEFHAKNDHALPYRCSFLACDRVGTKGWRRKVDMAKHMAKKHGQVVEAATVL
ncbi:uncharacterized protein LY89DRAFT_177754 [Mollisia scopiformis]|uniref:C2H2-type domain-containing protein n=1 Tax=Mollisia scopiformis TaxID=149040 RepID=A0A194XT98_MOLSC|nr:uncharacterized protein LY89DRAFT_177754 [Mollisia scopiformis]KUJ23274.1 hypothetical protein LY89DRAFT_177754 [Mollisia scopiformis]